MVGIGGGAPSFEHDIRLGDVGVSRPGKNDGGVIQYRYDYGRTVQEGRFIHSGTLNSPPAFLLNAVSALQEEYVPCPAIKSCSVCFPWTHTSLLDSSTHIKVGRTTAENLLAESGAPRAHGMLPWPGAPSAIEDIK